MLTFGRLSYLIIYEPVVALPAFSIDILIKELIT